MSQEQNSDGRKPRQKYTEEFKRSVVDHVLTSGKSILQVAGDFGISHWTVREWKRRHGLEAKPVDAPLPATPQAQEQEIQQLRKELARVTLQRDILKKTMGILSEP
jgi:transposase